MKTSKRLSLLQFFIKIILIGHIVSLLLLIWFLKVSWMQLNINPEDLKGAVNLYSVTNLGYLDIGFEFVYNKGKYENGQLLYSTGIGYLEKTNKSAGILESSVSYQNEEVDVSFTRLPLVIPVSSVQRRNLILLASAYSILMIFYSMLIFFLLWKYIKSLIVGNSLSKSNLNHLYTAGILVIIIPLIKYALQYFEISWIRSNFNFDEYSIISNYSFQISLLGLGILIIAITETLRQGIKIKKEHELTI